MAATEIDGTTPCASNPPVPPEDGTNDPARKTPSAFRTRLAATDAVEWVRREMSRRAAAGFPLRAEDYRVLPPIRDLTPSGWMELIALEIELRRNRGETPTFAEYVQRFPDWSSHLEQIALRTETAEASADSATLRVSPHHVSLRPDPPESAFTPRIPGYRIESTVGRGGMGVVYKAVQEGLNRVVALKMILNHLAPDSEERKRFQIEAESVAALRHPNIVQVFDIGEHESRPFLALEYVDGGTLHHWANGQAQDPRFAAEMVEQLALAVDHAHRQGILHRDLKPANILLARQPESPNPDSAPKDRFRSALRRAGVLPKITDFGLAKRIDAPNNLTQTGFVAGTPQYMPPEQIRATRKESVGPAADTYALGVILYELLCGKQPFQSEHPLEIMNQVLRQEAPPPRRIRKEIPRDLETVCLKCLEKDPSKRYHSAAALAAELAAFLEGRPILARPVGPVSQGWRWCRRYPVVAGLLFAIFLTMSVAVWVVSVLATVAEENADRSEQHRRFASEAASRLAEEVRISTAHAEEADRERKKAEDNARKVVELDATHRRQLYAARMLQVMHAHDAGNVRRARELLSQAEPTTPGESDFRGFEWYYLNALCSHVDREFRVPHGARGLAISPDGESIAWGFLNTGTIYNLVDGKERITLRTDPRERLPADDLEMLAVRRLTYSPDGNLLAIGSQQHPLQVWSVKEPKPLFDLAAGPFQPGAVAFSPDSKFIGLGEDPSFPASNSRFVRVFRVEDGKVEAALPVHESGVIGVQFTSDGKTLITLTRFGKLRYWSWPEPKLIEEVSTPFPARCLAIAPDDSELAVGHLSGSVTIYSTRTKKELRRNPAHRDVIEALAYNRNSKLLASGCRNGVVKIWRAGTGELFRICRGHEGEITALRFDPNGPVLYSASLDGRVLGWEFLKERDKSLFEPRVGKVASVRFDATGDVVELLGEEGFRVSYDLAKRREVPKSRQGATEPSQGWSFAPVSATAGDRTLVVSNRRDRIFAWPADGSAIVPLELPGLRPEIVNLATSVDGKRLATIHRDMGVCVRSLDGSAPAIMFPTTESNGRLFRFHPTDSNLLLIGGHDGAIRA